MTTFVEKKHPANKKVIIIINRLIFFTNQKEKKKKRGAQKEKRRGRNGAYHKRTIGMQNQMYGRKERVHNTETCLFSKKQHTKSMTGETREKKKKKRKKKENNGS